MTAVYHLLLGSDEDCGEPGVNSGGGGPVERKCFLCADNSAAGVVSGVVAGHASKKSRRSCKRINGPSALWIPKSRT